MHVGMGRVFGLEETISKQAYLQKRISHMLAILNCSASIALWFGSTAAKRDMFAGAGILTLVISLAC